MVITVSIMGLRFYADADMMNSFVPFEILGCGGCHRSYNSSFDR